MQRFYILLIGVLLAGCATVGTNVASDIAGVPADKGVVIFSTGAEQTNFSFSTALWLVDGESLKRYDKVIINLDYPFSSHFPGTHVHVRSLTLKPGLYYLVPVPGNPFFRTTRAPIYAFKALPGRVTYIGSVSLKNRSLLVTAAEQERDMSYFLARNPKLRGESIKTELMTVDRYIHPDTPTPLEVKGIIWEAPQ